jgi:DNA polymerase IIIc chi subunit
MIQVSEDDWATLKAKADAFDALERLRANQGAGVELTCDNEETDAANQVVTVSVTDEWTNWQPRSFTGRTLIDAIENAEHERSLAIDRLKS